MTGPRRIIGVVLAAGLSSRMGMPKALLDWNGEPLIAYQVRQLFAAGVGTVVAVTGHEAKRVEEALAGTGAIAVRNHHYREGRATSVRAAAEAIANEPDVIVLLNVDQPRRSTVTERLLREHSRLGGCITVPAYAGRRGHPVILSGTLLPELRFVSEEEQGLKAIMRRHERERREVAFEEEEVILDLNDPDAYARAVNGWQQPAG